MRHALWPLLMIGALACVERRPLDRTFTAPPVDASGPPIDAAHDCAAFDPTCDGVDDDCDGTADEDYVGPTTCGVGVCAEMVAPARCVSGVTLPCRPGEPGTETCDGRDEDCDGTADEGVTMRCAMRQGRCAAGVRACVEGAFADCDVAPIAETCNGQDDDCDGQTDEDVVEACGGEVGACSEGLRACEDGAFGPCVPRDAPTPETCNGVDDDCDGAIDEGLRRACGVDVAPCRAGEQTCAAGAWGPCEGEIAPGEEVCNGADDDCDRTIDEGPDPRCGACAMVFNAICANGAACNNLGEPPLHCARPVGVIAAPEGASGFGEVLVGGADLDGDGADELLVGAADELIALDGGGGVRFRHPVDLPQAGFGFSNLLAEDHPLVVLAHQGMLRVLDPSGEEVAALDAGQALRVAALAALPDQRVVAVADPAGAGGAGLVGLVFHRGDGLDGELREVDAPLAAKVHLLVSPTTDELSVIALSTEPGRAGRLPLALPVDGVANTLGAPVELGLPTSGAATSALFVRPIARRAPVYMLGGTDNIDLFDRNGNRAARFGVINGIGRSMVRLQGPAPAELLLLGAESGGSATFVWLITEQMAAIASITVPDAGPSFAHGVAMGRTADGWRAYIGEPDAPGGGRVLIFAFQ
ncbi:MAG: hypothetical protein KC620_12710 [Myxococcales bacterium]|nr:hypothetical protein [Myxococcales bacterium]